LRKELFMNSEVEKLQSVTVGELINFFEGPKAIRKSEPAVNAARLALGSLSAVGRIKATERAEQGMKLAVVRMIAKDLDEAKAYIAATTPELAPPKLLDRPKKK